MARLEACAPREPRAPRVRRERPIIYGATAGVRAAPKRISKHRRLPAAELMPMLDVRDIRGRALRPVRTYTPTTGDARRQAMALLDHLFVDYGVPAFLYPVCLREERPFHHIHPVYRRWFIALAQGERFPKLVQPYMTGREAHLFLSAPPRNEVHENVWWAKMAAAGLPDAAIHDLIHRIFTHFLFVNGDGRLMEVVRFFARFHADMDPVTFGEITDCLVWKLTADPEFRMGGRTVGSMRRVTAEWHALMHNGTYGRLVEWKGMRLRDWEHHSADKTWRVAELRNNRALLHEGRAQRNCVFSYVAQCAASRSAIFSLRAYPTAANPDAAGELTRVTIEVSSDRAVVQAKGRFNRALTAEEARVLRRWAEDKGLRIEV